jgi:adenine-specific DNA glycosylase
VVFSGQKALLFRRPVDHKVLTGMWELPWVERDGDSAVAALGRKYGGRWRLLDSYGIVRHSITFRRLEVEVHAADWVEPREVASAPEIGWLDAEELTRRPVSSWVTKALALAH